MQKSSRILVIGSLNFDIILEQERLPQLGETYQVDRVTTGGGGKGANQAVQAAKMGVSTMMIGALGRDLYGRHIEAQLKEFGVDTSHILISDESTGLGINNVLPDGSVYGNIVRGANFALTPDYLAGLEAEIAKSDIVLFQMEIPTAVTELGIELAKKHGSYVILNAAPALPIDQSKLASVDCLIVNETEASFYAGQSVQTLEDALTACEILHEKVNGLVIITLGAGGSLLYNGREKIFIPARKVRAVDTTGAGDSYVGVFAAKLLQGVSPEEAVIWATLASSITVTEPGTQVAMPNLADLEEVFGFDPVQPVYY